VIFSPEIWTRISPLLNEALELEPARRGDWLESLAPEHSDLRETLRQLLQADSGLETRDFFPCLAQLDDIHLSAGARVGPYKLIRPLGAGGMAVVWLAERADGAMRRQVALKLPRMALLHHNLAARMAHERDIVAALEHPNIARLYDAGVDASGRPYLALEYVDGVPIDQYCRAHPLTLEQRLALFLQIARAVSFAHGRLIVHRDLKPSNILVTDGGGVRLLDFGIAGLLQLELSAGVQHTQFGTRAFTPSYAAPEQFTGHAISAATDVYSLGVILYELLTGTSPYPVRTTSRAALEQAVLEDEPPLASTVAKARTDRRALRGDLDSILAKALKKSPAERYLSVDAFAADIERHESGHPILARPLSRWYRARKFARRNAPILSFATAVVASLAVGLGIAVWQWKVAEAHRVIAMQRLAQTRATLDFTRAVLSEGMTRDETITLDTLLARSEAMAHAAGGNDPETRAAAADFVSGLYFSYDLSGKAEDILTQAINELPAEFSPSTKSWFVCKRAALRARNGRTAEAIAALAHEIERNKYDAETAAYCLESRAQVARDLNDARGALAYNLEALQRFEAAGGQTLPDKAVLLGDIGYAYSLNGDSKRAEAYLQQSIAAFDRSGRGESSGAMATFIAWGAAAANAGNTMRALELYEQSLAIARRRAPTKDPPSVLLLNRAIALTTLGRYAEASDALDFARQVAQRAGRVMDEASALNSKADILRREGRLDEAQMLLDQAAEKLRALNTPESGPIPLRQKLFQGQVWAAQGRLAEATSAITQVIDTFAAQRCCGGARSRALIARAEVALRAQLLGAALADAQQALELARHEQGEVPYSNFTGSAWLSIARINEAQGRFTEAHQAYAAAAVHLAHTLGEQHPDTLEARKH
jgi:serine/threonine-protein kinase